MGDPARAGERDLVLIEAKASSTVYPEAAASALRLARSIGTRGTRCVVVHPNRARRHGDGADDTALAPGARSMSVAGLLRALRGDRMSRPPG